MSTAAIPYNGCKVVFADCEPTDYIEGGLLKGRWYELANLEYIRGLGVKGVYLDAGAYIGTHSLFFALFCRCSYLWTIEAQPDAYRKLVGNLRANGLTNTHYTAIETALGRHVGRCKLSGNASNRGGWTMFLGDDVKVRPLDFFGIRDVALAKIDVENSELAVLQGGQTTLRNADHLFVEIWPEETCRRYKVEYRGDKIKSLLMDWGFVHEEGVILTEDLQHFRRA